MKIKICIFFGILALLAGLRLFDNGLIGIEQAGTFTAYTAGGGEAVFESADRPVLDRFSGYTRLDVSGDIQTAYAGLRDISACVLWTEKTGDIVIIYAYSPYINKFETVHSQKVNVMAAVTNGRVSYGCPLLKGSY